MARMRTVLILLALAVEPLLAVKDSDFKTCSQAGFCRRGRALADRAADAGKSWKSPYSIDPSSVAFTSDKSYLVASVVSELYPAIQFELKVQILENGVARVRMNEINGLNKRYDEAANWALVSSDPALKGEGQVKWTESSSGLTAAYDNVQLDIKFSPLKVTLLRDGVEQVVVNGRGLLHMEHFRTKEVAEAVEGEEGGDQKVLEQPKPNAWFEGDPDDGAWEETWISWTDQKPKGPESLSLDIDFPNHSHLYGLPQHAAPLALPDTRGEDSYFEEPYRLYNGDIFEYPASSSRMSLYGSIPLLHAQSTKSTVGVFSAVASETWVDVKHPKEGSSSTHWISESGILDLFLIPGPTPADVFSQYAWLTGTSSMPAQWALGHHQCRWNYISTDDVRSVSTRFDEADMPVDVLWLDIEYAEEHKYFVWEKNNFPDPIEMTNDVAAVARKMVVIVDPHIKRVSSFPVFAEAEKEGLLVKKSDLQDYEGWCWTGSSAWVDFFNPAATSWWKGLFSLVDQAWITGFRWKESTGNMFIWNDMNEPAVFNGPEITMPKDNVHHGGWEHRDVHNINGMLFHKSTSLALVNRTGDGIPRRPFVLSRSFFAGSQKYGAIWTGDNMGTWEHMEVGVKMTLTDGIAGMTFSGADVGGFFGNPEPEMLVRWYQVGAFAPFFRAHGHIDTKRREPFLFDEPYKSMMRDILRLRYSLLPVWYTAFREASANGVPILRPQYVAFPTDAKGFAIDDQYYLGNSGLLVKPVTKEGQTEVEVYVPDNQAYFDWFDYTLYRGQRGGSTFKVAAPLEKVPLFIRGGSIVPTRQRPRRSSPLMKYDPFTLTIAIASPSTTALLAEGELYLDDGETFAHVEKGELLWRQFKLEATKTAKKSMAIKLSSRDLVGPSVKAGKPIVDTHAASTFLGASIGASESVFANYDPTPEGNPFIKSVEDVSVEKIVILGMATQPRAIRLGEGGEKVDFTFKYGPQGSDSVLIIKSPKVSIAKDWDLVFQL